MYHLNFAYNSRNSNQYGYVLIKDNEIVKQIMFDKETMAYSDIVKNKINFLTEILNEYPEINWKRMLITLVAKDNDIVEFYKQIFYKKDCVDPQERTEVFDKKVTPDEKLYLDVCLNELRKKLEDN